jgi:hypothetical protein
LSLSERVEVRYPKLVDCQAKVNLYVKPTRKTTKESWLFPGYPVAESFPKVVVLAVLPTYVAALGRSADSCRRSCRTRQQRRGADVEQLVRVADEPLEVRSGQLGARRAAGVERGNELSQPAFGCAKTRCQVCSCEAPPMSRRPGSRRARGRYERRSPLRRPPQTMRRNFPKSGMVGNRFRDYERIPVPVPLERRS